MTEFFIEDVIERCNRTFVHIGGDFVLVEDSPISCPFLKVSDWRGAWMALYLRKLKFGQFTDKRHITDHCRYVPFGASEIIMDALEAQILDAAVLVCDGAGTVITERPELVQGIGGRMSGLVYTTPRHNTIHKLERKGAIVLNPETARIDPVEGVKKALELYKRIAVTVTASRDIERLRELSDDISIFVVHTTGVTPPQSHYTLGADIVWGCASLHIREITGPQSLLQLGVAIPVFVLTERGINLIIPRICAASPGVGRILKEKRDDILSGTTYLIHHVWDYKKVDLTMEKCALPVLVDKGPHPLI